MLLIRYIVNSTIIFINELVFIIPILLIELIVRFFFLFLPLILALGLIIFSVDVGKHSELLAKFLLILSLIMVIPTFFAEDFYGKYTKNIADFVIKILTYPFNKVRDTINSIFSITTEMELKFGGVLRSKFTHMFFKPFIKTTKSKFLKLIISFFINLTYFIKGGALMILKKTKNIKKTISKKTKNIVDEGKKID
jgi:hypothetical protein